MRMYNKLTGLAVFTGALFSIGAECDAATRAVPSQYATIQSAVNAAQHGDNVLVAPGTYNEAINMLGKAITLSSTGGPAVTTIDAWLLSSSAIKCVSGEGPGTVIDGFTITRGSGTYEASRRKGGGMLNKASSPTVRNCIFKNNSISAYEHTVDGGGAGMYNELGAAPRVIDCSFSNNQLLGCSGWLNGGAGMYNDASSPLVANCTFTNNSGNNGGGMMNIRGAAPDVVNCRFTGNHADFSGGAINVTDNSSANICNNVFDDNTAFHGAAVYTHTSDVEIINSTLSNNHATRTGGGLFTLSSASATTIANSIFWNNLADQEPGDKEIANWGGPAPAAEVSTIQGGYPGGNFTQNPLFVNAAAGDFRLREDSPALDIAEDGYLPADMADVDGDGNTSEQVPLDIAMSGRISGDALDLGAYEYALADLCPADITPVSGNGIVNVDDVLAVVSAMGMPCSNCPQDIAPSGGNNVVNIDDLLEVISAWGDCP